MPDMLACLPISSWQVLRSTYHQLQAQVRGHTDPSQASHAALPLRNLSQARRVATQPRCASGGLRHENLQEATKDRSSGIVRLDG